MTKHLFLQSILKEFYTLAHTLVPNNYDARRFSRDGVDRSKDFNLANHTAQLKFFIANWEGLFTTFLLLNDNESKQLFVRLILFRLLGHLHVRIKPDVTAETRINGLAFVKGFMSGDSDVEVLEKPANLKHFENLPFQNTNVKVDCSCGNAYNSFINKQYFLERNHIRIRPEYGDTCIDAGACFGDTGLSFALSVGETGKVFSFDPLPTHVAVYRHNIRQNNLEKRMQIVPYSVGSKTNNIRKVIEKDGGGSPGFNIIGKEDIVPIISIDEFIYNQKVQRVDFIKMDIEGSELAALKGAKETISRDRPKLAISLYHKPEDFILIPQYIKAEHPDYDLYIDHYTIHAEETILYGIARSNKSK